jgi:hypothetical protein
VSARPPAAGPHLPWYAASQVVRVAVLASVPAKMLSGRLADPDLWWHLRTGALIIARGSVPRADEYSYTVPGRPWVVQEWGSEAILHGLRRAFGLWGIFWWRALMLTAVYLVVARLLRRRMGDGMATWALLGLVAYAGSANWTERPNLFSFLLFVALLALLERRGRAIWWFVPLAAAWANLHGMVVLGLGTLAVVAAAEGCKVAFGWEGADRAWARRLGLVLVASAAATLLNPRGPALLAHALSLVRVASQVVTEWASPDFHEITSILFLALLVVTVAALALAPGRPDLTDLALALAFTVLGLQAARNLALAAIVLGLVAARSLPGALEALPPRGSVDAPRIGASPGSPVLGAAGLVLALGGLAVVVAAGFPRSDRPADIVGREYPLASLDAVEGPGARVFAFDFWAGYLIDRAWPGVRVFYDTRVDLYGLDGARRYARTIAGLPGWREALEETCTTHVIVRPRRDPLAELLRLVPEEWRLVREEPGAVTFVRTGRAPGCPGG